MPFAAGTFVYCEFRPPSHHLPPWEDPEILFLALLFLLAPIGMILGAVAGARGAPKWLICVVEIAHSRFSQLASWRVPQFGLKTDCCNILISTQNAWAGVLSQIDACYP